MTNPFNIKRFINKKQTMLANPMLDVLIPHKNMSITGRNNSNLIGFFFVFPKGTRRNNKDEAKSSVTYINQ